MKAQDKMSTVMLKMNAQKWAEEEAEKDLKFAGDAALAKLPISETERAALRGGLIHYARNAASRTVSMLKLHNYLQID